MNRPSGPGFAPGAGSGESGLHEMPWSPIGHDPVTIRCRGYRSSANLGYS